MDIILGIDPGSRVTGYGIIEANGDKHSCLGSGCIAIDGFELSSRLQQVYQGLIDIIQEFNPTCSAIEQVFMHRNASSALKLGQARGAAVVAVGSQEIPLAEYSPRQIKQAVVGYGAADKLQIQQMVKKLLSLPELPQPDAADALAVALCHANSRGGVMTRGNYLRRSRHNRLAPYLEDEQLIVEVDPG